MEIITTSYLQATEQQSIEFQIRLFAHIREKNLFFAGQADVGAIML
jgi:hypothetical protein